MHEYAPVLAALRQLLVELSERYEVPRLDPRQPGPTIARPEDAARILEPEMADLAQEQLRVLLLDARSRLMGTVLVAQGDLDSLAFRPACALRDAVARSATAIILAHNHPSGDPTPSRQDMATTEAVRQAGQLLGIQVLDHIIVGQGRWTSLARKGRWR